MRLAADSKSQHVASQASINFSSSAAQEPKRGDTYGPSHELAPEILPAFPYCFKTPQHKGSDIRTITRIPTTIPPMEPPYRDAAYASSPQTGIERPPHCKCETMELKIKLKLPMTNLSWGPKGAVSLTKSVVPQFRNIKLAGRCKFLQTCTDPIWDAIWQVTDLQVPI